jgi:DNA-binding transcriptional regulator YdaS (Cro superfamily)
MKPIDNPVDLAIAVAGSAYALAEKLGVTRQCITHWRRSGSIPIAKVPDVSRVTGIPKAKLHDAFKPEKASA